MKTDKRNDNTQLKQDDRAIDTIKEKHTYIQTDIDKINRKTNSTKHNFLNKTNYN